MMTDWAKNLLLYPTDYSGYRNSADASAPHRRHAEFAEVAERRKRRI